MFELQNENQPKVWYIKFWEVQALVAMILIGLLFEDQKLYSLILFSLSAIPLFNQVLTSKKYNTGIFFILVLKLFITSIVVVKIFIACLNYMKKGKDQGFGQVISCTIHMTFLTSTMVTLAYYRYFSSQVTKKQISIEVFGAIAFILCYTIFYQYVNMISITLPFRILLQLMFTAYLLVIRKHEGISLLWIGMNILSKLNRMEFSVTNNKFVEMHLIWIIVLELINFILVMLYKYGFLKRNLSKIVKNKLNMEFGDYQKEKYDLEKQV